MEGWATSAQAMLRRRCSPPDRPRTRMPPGSTPPTCAPCVCYMQPASKLLHNVAGSLHMQLLLAASHWVYEQNDAVSTLQPALIHPRS